MPGPSPVLGWLGMGVASLGLALFVGGTIAGGDSWVRRAWSQQVARDEATLRFIRAGIGGHAYLGLQVGLVVLALGASMVEEEVLFLVAAAGGVALLRLSLSRRRAQRIATIEAQLDTWLGALSNALRATPSLGEALSVTAEVIRGPISEEVDHVLKQTRLGVALEQALLELSDRIGSPLVTSALAALFVGRQTGGDLPSILDETSAGLREMARLQGVLDAKTSDSRMQAYVMLAIPFLVLLGIHRIDPSWLGPMSESTTGMIASAVAAALWLSAVVLARRILDVAM